MVERNKTQNACTKTYQHDIAYTHRNMSKSMYILQNVP